MAIHDRVWERASAPTADPWNDRPWRPQGTYALLGVMVGVWILQQVALMVVRSAFAALDGGATSLPFGLALYRGEPVDLASFTFVLDTDFLWRPWTLVTSTVAHSFTDITHLVFNGLFLFFFGPTAERLVGTKRFLVLFFLGGALSGVLQVELASAFGNGGGALGASGALMLLFGLLIVLLPNQKLLVYGVLPVPFWAAGIGYAALDVLGTFNPASRIGNYAHLSGMALGLAYGWWFRRDLARKGMRVVTR